MEYLGQSPGYDQSYVDEELRSTNLRNPDDPDDPVHPVETFAAVHARIDALECCSLLLRPATMTRCKHTELMTMTSTSRERIRLPFLVTIALVTILFAILRQDAVADDALATIAVISNPYITTLPAEQIVDETGANRGFLAQTGPQSMEKTIALVNQLQPDALIVLGSLTWSGSDADFAVFTEYANQFDVPTYFTSGHRDRLQGSLTSYATSVGNRDTANQLRSINDVTLVFDSDLHTDPDKSCEQLEQRLSQVEDSKAVLLFCDRDRSMGRTKLSEDHDQFWSLVERHDIALRFEPTRYGYRVGYEQTLPIWAVGSTAWSERGAVTVVRVFEDRIELAQVSDLTQTPFSLTVPNPVSTSRMELAANDPYRCPSLTKDLQSNPDFTFALVSDPQFDREANRDYLIQKADAAIEELNRLNPAMVFIAGDLVNNNLPEEWELFNQAFSKLKPPRHVVPGNHDVLFNYDFIEPSLVSAREKKPEYATIVADALSAANKEGFAGPTALYEKYTGAKPRQVLHHQRCAFVMVPFLTTRADQQQIDFLREQLELLEDKEHVFVVAHYPSLSSFGNNVQPQLGGSEVLALLHQHKVTGYLFGHRHANGFRMHDRTAHVLTDNMLTIHLLHVFPDHVVVGRKRVGEPLYEKVVVPSPRK